MTRVAIVGAHGMLGRDLCAALPDSVPLARADLDVTDAEWARDVLSGFDIIVNCTAWNQVDDAESQEMRATAVNALGAENVALAARATHARLIQLSTDYVFDGSATTPIPEESPRNPVSAYGRSKAAGEELALAANPGATSIVRTAWLYGRHGPSFPRTMLRLAAERATVSVVDDQVGQPTWSRDLADQLVRLIDAGAPPGVFHGTNAGQTSWFEFAREVFRLAGLDPERVLPTDSKTFVRPAPRPAYSVLGHDGWARVGIPPMRPWREAIAAAFDAGVFA